MEVISLDTALTGGGRGRKEWKRRRRKEGRGIRGEHSHICSIKGEGFEVTGRSDVSSYTR